MTVKKPGSEYGGKYVHSVETQCNQLDAEKTQLRGLIPGVSGEGTTGLRCLATDYRCTRLAMTLPSATG